MVREETLRLALAACLALSLAACSARSAAPPPPSAPIPSDSPLAEVKPNMSDTDVRSLLGEPASSRSYMTGKTFIPYYYGSDTSRTEWRYTGQGLITFSRNRYSGSLKVIRVTYDPSQ